MSSSELYTKYIQPGRLCYIDYGKDKGKIAFIVDIMSLKRVLIVGPTTNVSRCVIPIKWITLSEFCLENVPRGCKTSLLKSLLEKSDILEKLDQSKERKKRLAQDYRKSMTDFDRFRLMVALKRRRKIMKDLLKTSSNFVQPVNA